MNPINQFTTSDKAEARASDKLVRLLKLCATLTTELDKNARDENGELPKYLALLIRTARTELSTS